jgi:ABC-2 type transport system permease protein
MNVRSDAVDSAFDPPEGAPAVLSPTRPLYWSVRRELWENRSIYIGPLAVAAVLLVGFLISSIRLPDRMRELSKLAPAEQYERVLMPYNAAVGLPVVAAFLIGMFYCHDALHGERRDRSILFWKSLPVSDRTAVLSKASIPLVVLPLLIYPVIIVTHLIMLLVSSSVLFANGASVAQLWARLPLFQLWLAALYGLTAIALWHAPIYGWLLLVSAWARRAPFLWAVLPLLAITVFERIAFGTLLFGSLIKHRLIGWFTLGFDLHPPGSAPGEMLAHLSPGRVLGTPGLWLGLLFAGACLAAAVRLRRYREPV